MLPNEVENSSPMQIAGLSVNDRTSRVKNKFGLGLSFFFTLPSPCSQSVGTAKTKR